MNAIIAPSMTYIKQQLYTLCADRLKAKIEEVHSAIALQQESTKGETKSSAGDKYETGTAMTHLELEKLGNQLMGLETNLRKLNAFQDLKPSKSVQAGSFIKTKYGSFWISIGMGEVYLGADKHYVISPVSPIAQRLLGKEAGYEFVFNKKKDCILEVL
jgi:transcription elongation GreA/GreB family factor